MKGQSTRAFLGAATQLLGRQHGPPPSSPFLPFRARRGKRPRLGPSSPWPVGKRSRGARARYTPPHRLQSLLSPCHPLSPPPQAHPHTHAVDRLPLPQPLCRRLTPLAAPVSLCRAPLVPQCLPHLPGLECPSPLTQEGASPPRHPMLKGRGERRHFQ